jgi:hypothetical protein
MIACSKAWRPGTDLWVEPSWLIAHICLCSSCKQAPCLRIALLCISHQVIGLSSVLGAMILDYVGGICQSGLSPWSNAGNAANDPMGLNRLNVINKTSLFDVSEVVLGEDCRIAIPQSDGKSPRDEAKEGIDAAILYPVSSNRTLLSHHLSVLLRPHPNGGQVSEISRFPRSCESTWGMCLTHPTLSWCKI